MMVPISWRICGHENEIKSQNALLLYSIECFKLVVLLDGYTATCMLAYDIGLLAS